MESKDFQIKDFKNMLITSDKIKNNGDEYVRSVRNFFISKELVETSKKGKVFFEVVFKIKVEGFMVDNTYYENCKYCDSLMKDNRYDMYFEYNNKVYNVPLFKLTPKVNGIGSRFTKGSIFPMDEIQDSVEIENYRHTMKKMGVK